MEKKTQLIFLEDSKGIVRTKDKIGNLYVLADEEIKDGFILHHSNEIGKVISTTDSHVTALFPISGEVTCQKYNCKKIIATTDKSLENWRIAFTGIPPKKSKVKFPNEQLPQPSQSFIEKYVEEYNKGNQIVDITLEYENSIIDGMPVVKVSLKDNTVTIRKMKDSWNREEVIKLLNGFEKLCYLYQANKDWFPAKKTKWIEENL